MTDYAVLDLETTGLFPEKHDRVVEVAVVHVDDTGQVEREWCSLVNPCRDLGPSHIHGIHARDLLDAPTFSEIADDLLDLVDGRVLVMHNAPFDARFLRTELMRAGYPVITSPSAFCTMKWSRSVVGPAKLWQVCAAFGIPLHMPHTALDDARATAQLLLHLRHRGASFPAWQSDTDLCSSYAWPSRLGVPAKRAVITRDTPPPHPLSWLHAALLAAEFADSSEDEASYMLCLERALLDGSISLTEGRELVEVATEAGLTRETIERLHRNYLGAVAVEALADGVITAAEEAELVSVAAALGLSDEEIRDSLDAAAAGGLSTVRAEFRLDPGDRVVFTGQMSRSRDEWIATITAAGLVSGGVNKATKVLVTSDPDSMSGKAAKARSYGVAVIDEAAFERYFDEYQGRQ